MNEFQKRLRRLRERRKTMQIETAVKKLRAEYERAVNLEFVRDPVAYALYQVEADTERRG